MLYNVPSWGPGKVEKWLGKPLFPVPVPFPVQHERFCIMLRKPFFPVPVPFKFCLNKP